MMQDSPTGRKAGTPAAFLHLFMEKYTVEGVYMAKKAWNKVPFEEKSRIISEMFPNVKLLKEYVTQDVGTNKKRGRLQFECKIDGHIWETSFDAIKRTNGCPRCAGKAKYTIEDVAEYVHNNTKCRLLSKEYINTKAKIKLLCHCGNEFETTFYQIIGRGIKQCSDCSHKNAGLKRRKSHEQYVAEVEATSNGKYKVVGKYTNQRTKIKIMCNDCNYKWMVLPAHILTGQGCPNCNESIGEKAVAGWLRTNGIEYKREYRFIDCKHKKTLPFDFYLPEYRACIEYDGELHYNPARYSENKAKMKSKLAETQRNDKIKTTFCLSSGIPLLRIPYTEYGSINTRLKNFISENAPIKGAFLMQRKEVGE